MKTLKNVLQNIITMATFKITKKTTVAELKEQFSNEVGGTLRIYEGRSEASNDATLVSLGAKEGELECRTSRTVGKFVEAFQNELNLKVKVCTNDNWVAVLDGITLSTVKDIPNNTTKALMEKYLGYQREDDEKTAESSKIDKVEIPEELKGMPLFDIEFQKIQWPMSDEVREQLDEGELGYSYGGVLMYATDENGDSVSNVMTGDISDSGDYIDEFVEENEENYPEIAIYIPTGFYVYGAEKEDYDCLHELGRGLGAFAGMEDYEYTFQWDLETPVLFRVKMDGKTHVFRMNTKGYFDYELKVNDVEFDKLIELTKAGLNPVCDFFDPSCRDFVGDRALVWRNSWEYGCLYGYINKSGKAVIPFIYTTAYDFNEEGYAAVEKDDHTSIINTKGEVVFEGNFSSIGAFSEGVWTVKEKDSELYGFINTKFELVIKPQFKRASAFSSGLARVEIDGKTGFINHQGEMVLQTQFDVSSFDNGLAKIKVDKKYGFINTNGEIVIKPQFDWIFDEHSGWTNGQIKVEKDNREFYINMVGEEVTKNSTKSFDDNGDDDLKE